jgi:hypothetical protein
MAIDLGYSLAADGIAAPAVPDNEGQEINTNIFNATNIMEDITRMSAEGFEVVDDNEALPENVPVIDAPAVKVSADGLYQGQTWGWDGIGKRATAGAGYKDLSFKSSWPPHYKTYLEIFTHFLPFMWLEAILLPKTSAELEKSNSPPLTLSELMRFIDMHLLMLMLQGWTSNKYWYYDPFPKLQKDARTTSSWSWQRGGFSPLQVALSSQKSHLHRIMTSSGRTGQGDDQDLE